MSETDIGAIESVPETRRYRALGMAFRRLRKEWPNITKIVARLVDRFSVNGFVEVSWSREDGWRDEDWTFRAN